MDEVALKSFILRRRDVQMDSRRVYEKRFVTMPPEIEKAYRTARKSFILEWKGKEKDRTSYTVAQFHWIRRMCGGFIENEMIWDGKAKEVSNLLTGELLGEQVVIWISYNREIGLLLRTLRKVGITAAYIAGSVPVEDRARIMQRFQRGDIQVLILQWACASRGMDLSAAGTAIYYSTPLGNEARLQSEDRIVSIQDKSPLLFVDLIADNGIDYHIYKLMERKAAQSIRATDVMRSLRLEVQG
jgi:superfamily II DNA/RNA helicase